MKSVNKQILVFILRLALLTIIYLFVWKFVDHAFDDGIIKSAVRFIYLMSLGLMIGLLARGISVKKDGAIEFDDD